jgi:hypothetical protein
MAGWLNMYFFDIRYRSEGRAGCQIVLELFDALCLSFGQCLDSPVRQITHVPSDLMTSRGALREKTVSNALYFPAN